MIILQYYIGREDDDGSMFYFESSIKIIEDTPEEEQEVLDGILETMDEDDIKSITYYDYEF